jgi:hypothetical protein
MIYKGVDRGLPRGFAGTLREGPGLGEREERGEKDIGHRKEGDRRYS